MTAFQSTTLKRTFDVIYFGTLSAPDTQQVTAPRFSPGDALDEDDSDLPPGHPEIENSELGPVGSSDALPPGHPAIDRPASPHSHLPEASSASFSALAVAPARGSNAHVISQLSAQSAQLVGQRGPRARPGHQGDPGTCRGTRSFICAMGNRAIRIQRLIWSSPRARPRNAGRSRPSKARCAPTSISVSAFATRSC